MVTCCFNRFLAVLEYSVLVIGMSFCVDLVSEDSFYENITLGITKLLEADPRVSDVAAEWRAACDRVAIASWEQKHSLALPDDVRNFYSSTDGFLLKWHYKYSADEILPVGSININTLSELCLSSSLKDLLDFALTRPSNASQAKPTLNTKSKVLELDDCRTIGKVCLVYAEGAWSVWLLSREGAWAWLAPSFTHYLRMALVHLGLPGWQALFSNMGLIPWAEQLFYLLAPHLLEKVEQEKPGLGAGDCGFNQIDANIFKNTSRHYARGAAANRPANQ